MKNLHDSFSKERGKRERGIQTENWGRKERGVPAHGTESSNALNFTPQRARQLKGTAPLLNNHANKKI